MHQHTETQNTNTNIAKTDPPSALHQLENRQMHTEIQNANTNTKHKYKMQTIIEIGLGYSNN